MVKLIYDKRRVVKQMKEAAGEANITVITIVLIGVVAAAGALIIPRLMDSVKAKSCCTEYNGSWENGKCVGSSVADYSWSLGNYRNNVSNVKTNCGY